MKAKKKGLITLIYVFLFLAIILGVLLKKNLFSYISFGADTITIEVEGNLEKYINYYSSEQENGTLLQYDVTVKNEYDMQSKIMKYK